MNNGAFGENFPYSNFHDLNMDWIIKIAKDFLDQYTNIQQTITDGLDSLDNKAQELEALLQAWYNTHSEDIANQLADALNDLNDWYNTHEGYLDQYVASSIAQFNQLADQKAQQTIESIPDDYSTLSTNVKELETLKVTGIVKTITDIWTQGTIVSSSGISAPSQTKIRSEEADRNIISITPDSGFYVAVFVYDGETYLGNWNGTGYTQSLIRYEQKVSLVDIPANYDIRFVGSKTDEANITPEESIHFKAVYMTDESLQMLGKSADAHAVGEKINNIENILNPINANIVKDFKEIPDQEVTGMYISDVDLIANPNFFIFCAPIEQDRDYRIVYPNHQLYSATYGAIAITETFPTAGNTVNVLLYGSTTSQDIDYTFTAPFNGYVLIAPSAANRNYVHSLYVESYEWSTPATNLKIQCFGDSITDNSHNTWEGHHTWIEYISNRFGNKYSIALTNSAYGGSSLRNKNDDSVVHRVETLLQTDADIITVWAGTNDWADGANIGSMSTGDTTIMGATKAIIEYLSQNTTAEIIFATPMQRYNNTDTTRPVNSLGEPLNSAGLTLKEYCDAIETVCNFYGIDCIRMDKMAGFNRINIREFADDGLHPSTEKANTRIASIFYTEMLRLYQK